MNRNLANAFVFKFPKFKLYLYRRSTKLREGNVFTGVCHSVWGKGVSMSQVMSPCVTSREWACPGVGMYGEEYVEGWVSEIPWYTHPTPLDIGSGILTPTSTDT